MKRLGNYFRNISQAEVMLSNENSEFEPCLTPSMKLVVESASFCGKLRASRMMDRHQLDLTSDRSDDFKPRRMLSNSAFALAMQESKTGRSSFSNELHTGNSNKQLGEKSV